MVGLMKSPMFSIMDMIIRSHLGSKLLSASRMLGAAECGESCKEIDSGWSNCLVAVTSYACGGDLLCLRCVNKCLESACVREEADELSYTLEVECLDTEIDHCEALQDGLSEESQESFDEQINQLLAYRNMLARLSDVLTRRSSTRDMPGVDWRLGDLWVPGRALWPD